MFNNMFFDSQLIENLTNQIETNGQNQSNPVTSIGNSSLHGQNFGFDQNHSSTSIQQALAHTLTQAQGSHVQSTSQFDGLASQQMLQLQQMRMLGQYSQLGLNNFNGHFGQSYQNHGQSHQDTHQQSHHNDHDYGDNQHNKMNIQKRPEPDSGKASKDKKGKRKKTSNVKRPTTAYLYFVSKYREKIKTNGEPMPKAKEMMQECAAKWRNMSTEDKTPYQAMADVDKERWQTEKAAEKKPKDQWRPKRPPSAYFLFLRDFRENWKSEHEDELNQPVPDPKPASEETKPDTTVADDAAKTTENSNKEETKSEVVSDGESALQIDESASNNNKPQLPSGDQTAAKAVKKDKPIRKTSRVVEITKKAGEKWNSMTDEDKAPYVAKAQATRLKWEKELQIYKHELKIGKTGEEASNRLTDLTEAGEEAIDEYCSEIPNTVVEKKPKIEKPENDEPKLTQRQSPAPPPQRVTTPPSAQTPTPVFSPQSHQHQMDSNLQSPVPTSASQSIPTVHHTPEQAHHHQSLQGQNQHLPTQTQATNPNQALHPQGTPPHHQHHPMMTSHHQSYPHHFQPHMSQAHHPTHDQQATNNPQYGMGYDWNMYHQQAGQQHQNHHQSQGGHPMN